MITHVLSPARIVLHNFYFSDLAMSICTRLLRPLVRSLMPAVQRAYGTIEECSNELQFDQVCSIKLRSCFSVTAESISCKNNGYGTVLYFQ